MPFSLEILTIKGIVAKLMINAVKKQVMIIISIGIDSNMYLETGSTERKSLSGLSYLSDSLGWKIQK
jgi:hypothetical protein